MDLEFWSNVSIVWLSFLCFIGLIVGVVASIFAVKGMHTVVDRTPRLLRQAQGYSRAIRTRVESTSLQVAEPMVQVHAQSRKYTTFLDRLLRRPASPSKGDEKK